jgi:4-hydroxybenzoate polyprenyltransferase
MILETIEHIKNSSLSVGNWIIGFIGIVFIRFFLESLSSPTSSGIAAIDSDTLIQYGISFFAIAFGIVCILGFFTKQYRGTQNLILAGLPIIWLPPLIDILISTGKGYTVTYIFNSHTTLLLDFVRFFNPFMQQEMTYGIRIEILCIITAIYWYVWKIQKSKLWALCASFSTYLFIFLVFALPGIFYTFSNIHTGPSNPISSIRFISNTIQKSTLVHNTVQIPTSVSRFRFIELGFNKLLTQLCFIISIIFITVFFYKTEPKKLSILLKNSRIERVILYFFLLSTGIFFAYIKGYGYIRSWVDILSMCCLYISLYGAWMYAVHTNDREDIAIDTVSNISRPLITQTISIKDMEQIGFIWLGISLLGSWAAGLYPFFMNLVFTASYYIYSAEPLRLKRIPILSSFLISIACLSVVLSGFFFISIDKKIATFPILIACGILFVFTLLANIRDIKDIEGDRQQNIKTLPALYGKSITALVCASGILLVPFFVSIYSLYIFAIPTAFFTYKLATKKQYTEHYVLLVWLIFFICSVFYILKA